RLSMGMALAAPLARRLAELAVLLFCVTTLLFFLLRLAGDPAAIIAGEGAAPEDVVAIRAFYGLDQPLVLQYAQYIARVALFDFGRSISSGLPALQIVMER